MTDFIEAYDADTGKKLPQPVPASWVEKGSPFPNLRVTPSGARSNKTSADGGGADSKEKK